jgi:hypothetical protein
MTKRYRKPPARVDPARIIVRGKPRKNMDVDLIVDVIMRFAVDQRAKHEERRPGQGRLARLRRQIPSLELVTEGAVLDTKLCCGLVQRQPAID